MQRAFAPIIIIVVIAAFLIGIAATVGYFKLKPKPTAPTSQVQSSPTPADLSSETQVLEDETASWKTYTNREFGYFLKYPNDWAIQISELKNLPKPQDIPQAQRDKYIYNSDASIGFIPPESKKTMYGASLVIGVQNNSNKTSIKQWVDNYLNDLGLNYTGKRETIVISGLQGELLSNLPSMNGEAYHVFLTKGDKAFEFIIENPATQTLDQTQALNMLKKILSTFKFE